MKTTNICFMCLILMSAVMSNAYAALRLGSAGDTRAYGGRADRDVMVYRNVVPADVEYRQYTIRFAWETRRAVRLVRGPRDNSTIRPMSFECEADVRYEERYMEFHDYAFETRLAYVTDWCFLEDISEGDVRHDWTATAPGEGTGGPVPFCPTRWFHYGSVRTLLPAGIACTASKYHTQTYTLTSVIAPEGVGYQWSKSETVVDAELLGTVCVNFCVDPNSTNEPPYRLLQCAVSKERPFSIGRQGGQDEAWREMLRRLGMWVDRMLACVPGAVTRRWAQEV